MEKYIVSYYLVEEGAWNLRNYYTIDASELAKTIRRIESLGYLLTRSNIFVKSFESLDGDMCYLVYSIVELPNL